MKKNYQLLLLASFILFMGACKKEKTNPRETLKFTRSWKFILNDDHPEFKNIAWNDSAWRTLNLPHDWSIEGLFSEENPATPGGGALPGGIGWYRKTFTIDQSDAGKEFFIDFDGVYMNSEVWINGHFLGKRPYGYISFRYDLTPYIQFGGKNLLAVRVDNSAQPNSRWYSGSGIYRNVWLIKTNKVHVAHWGTYVTTPEVSPKEASVSVETTIENKDSIERQIRLKIILSDNIGQIITTREEPLTLAAGENKTVTQNLLVERPYLWSVENPYLYHAETQLRADGEKIDQYQTNFGIRSFRFDAKKGFYLNGKPLKIRGVCNHHDLGCLGSAINTRAIERQLEILKSMGCNAIRTSHNPPAPELLDLCDKMGFIVQDETFDMWRKKKTPYDYARYFPEWHERDLRDHILRDRNHPSVFMWSIGNEILEQWNDVNADTLDLQQANFLLNFDKNIDQTTLHSEKMSVNSLLALKLANMVKNIDPTRPVTSANNEVSPNNNLFKSGAMDIYGFNYHQQQFAGFPENFPGKKLIISESTSALMTRGFYQMPSDSMFIWPHRGETAHLPSGNPEQQCSSYDNCHVPWGSTHEETWKIVKKYDHISGMFVWTGFDYLGEPTPYWWPSRSSYFGIIDLAGFPKDVYYMYQSEWTDQNVLHVFPHWNWKEGQPVDVWVYTNAQEVELFLNGKSLGTKKKTEDDLHLMWRVPFEAGTLKAISRTNGQVVLEKEIKTAGAPAKIRLTADHSKIKADGYDLSFITAEVLDANGVPVPTAGNQIRFEVKGDAFIAGVDNGDPTSHESLKGSSMKAFNGKCLAVVQANETPGEVTFTAKADGLQEASVRLRLTE